MHIDSIDSQSKPPRSVTEEEAIYSIQFTVRPKIKYLWNKLVLNRMVTIVCNNIIMSIIITLDYIYARNQK